MANLVGKNPVFVSSSEAVAKSDAVVWIRIGEDADGQRLDNYLFRIAKGVPKSHLYRIVRAGEVRVNKKRATVDTRLSLGDELRVPPIRVSAVPKKEVARPIDGVELPGVDALIPKVIFEIHSGHIPQHLQTAHDAVEFPALADPAQPAPFL